MGTEVTNDNRTNISTVSTAKSAKNRLGSTPTKQAGDTSIAVELAKKQREISVAEFFEKNKHILGFDSLQRSIITCVKEAVDNSLDACEEACILPDIFVEINRVDKDAYGVIVEDNGPGIVKEQVSKVFGKLLYGSRFHVLRQSRGQQGIGISACVLYAQITTGKPVKIISKTAADRPACYFELLIDTRKNDAKVLVKKDIPWNRPRGTRVEMEVKGTYIQGKKSVGEYLKSTSIVNPHAKITFIDPDGKETVFDRATDVMPVLPEEIKPHPSGIELGMLLKMADGYKDSMVNFLCNEFARIGRKTADELCRVANLDPSARAGDMSREQAKSLIEAFKSVKIIAPPKVCLSPIGEELISRGLRKEYKTDFVSVVKREASVHSGHPFIVEAALAYGGNVPREGRIDIMRFANRVPLLYQQGGCAITHAISRINWKNYGLEQPQEGLPVGPVMVIVHVASTNVPFTSESKDAIADIPAILDEIELAVRDTARDLKNFLSRRKNLERRKEKEEIIKRLLPQLAEKTASILKREKPDIDPVVANIMGNVLIQKKGAGIRLKNFSDAEQKFKLRATSHKIEKNWDISLAPGEEQLIKFPAEKISVEGINEEMITGTCVVSETADGDGEKEVKIQ